MPPDILQYDHRFWNSTLGQNYQKISLGDRLHLIFSLIIYLDVSLFQLLEFVFTSSINAVRRRSGIFMGFNAAAKDPTRCFPPAVVFKAMHDNYPNARGNLHEMIVPCIEEIAVEESDRIINDKQLKITKDKLTYWSFQDLLTPGKLFEIYKDHAPVTWRMLYAFAASPNEHRKKMQRKEKKAKKESQEDEDLDFASDSGSDDSDGEDGEHQPDEDQPEGLPDTGGIPPKPKGFSRNPIFAVLIAIAMLTFVRNRATNVLPLLCGLFFKIEGTSSRVAQMLSNIGIAVSVRTVERIKESLSEDCIEHAVSLMLSGNAFCTIFDNINLYLRKFEQRMTNRNTMIHATNSAVIGIPQDGIDVQKAEDLKAKHALRGKRVDASFRKDIMPDSEDQAHLEKAGVNIIAEFIIRYTPGSSKWPNRAEMLEQVKKNMPTDRPLPVHKTDTRPLGVFDVNEGSKKGIVELLSQICTRSTMAVATWSTKVRIMLGDWLTSNNIRHARRDRRDDVDNMERLDYIAELSQLFHFALQATQMLVRTHLGNAVQDPTSLGRHKSLLGRTWDPNSLNYAQAKSAIRHSFIGRILHIVMSVQLYQSCQRTHSADRTYKGFTQWSQLANWAPANFVEVHQLSERIWKEWAATAVAEVAKSMNDDWTAHEIFFIRDAIIFFEFEQAVSYADAGRVLRVLKYWCLMFRGAGQHNYARECAEILLHWKYELTKDLRNLLERSWFVNRWGLDGRWIAADLYLEQLNLLVKRVFIAYGNGVTIQYIMKRGSACVESFRKVSHLIAVFFGDDDRKRKKKELAFQEDLRVLVEAMENEGIHKGMVADRGCMDTGAGIWAAKFEEFKRSTTYDPAVGVPLDDNSEGDEQGDEEQNTALATNTVFDEPNVLHIDFSTEKDIDDDGGGGVGGAGEFDTGEADED
ncbi:hypothetical protein NMY22_g3065 [Coprinellus aureogranulatus]|nr:hypothetical protein NMY22_g3065 [Coprinellus aureogranulatus]